MAARRTITAKVRAAARRNIRKAQLTRYRTREPRSIGRVRPVRHPASGSHTMPRAASVRVGRK